MRDLWKATPARRRITSLISITIVVAGSFTAAVATAAPAAQHQLHRLHATGHLAHRVQMVNAFGLPGTVHYAVDKPVCAPETPNGIRCFAVKRVDVPAGTAGAYRYVQPTAPAAGPAGGYTPNDLASIYGFNPNTNRSNQTVAIVDWFKDPNVRADLNHFDKQYGLPAETATSFRVVNQNGKASPLPKSDPNSAVEITLDVQSVRAVCHTCKILLIEANGPTDPNLATAQNTAARLGATAISDSYGEPEHRVAANIRAAYNHPGVVISVSTGDAGWFGWDFVNGGISGDNAPSFPSTAPTVVAVGGTNVTKNANGSRQRELVWNEDGREDENGLTGGPQGATGGGCSKLYTAKPWQVHYPNYSRAGCKGKRLAADVSAIADPQTGFDIYDSFQQPGWITVGGTSLAAPITAAMFALAGGAKGAAYPAATLYVNARMHAASVYDVQARSAFSSFASGSGFCGGVPAKQCGNFVFNNITGPNGRQTHNPNALGAGLLDCSFSHNPNNNHNATSTSRECNTFPGYDGPTGLGAPKSLRLFTATNPTTQVTAPATVRVHQLAHFRAQARAIVPNTHVTRYQWTWGDGRSTTSRHNTATHRYAHAGHFTAVLRVTDSRFQVTIKRVKVTVKAG